MKISLIYRYPDLKQRFLAEEAKDELNESLDTPEIRAIYAEAQARLKKEQERNK
jgi:hypothetical protein